MTFPSHIAQSVGWSVAHPNMFPLPLELLQQIMCYLSLSDLCQCLQVSSVWRSFLQSTESLWVNARYHFNPELSLPLPPPGVLSWRHATWIYGYRQCTHCKQLTAQLPYCTVYRLVFCNDSCVLSFCKEHITSPQSEPEWARAKYIIPVPRRLYITHLTTMGFTEKFSQKSFYIREHLANNVSTLFLLSPHQINEEDEKIRHQVAKSSRIWLMDRDCRAIGTRCTNFGALQKWLLKQGIKQKDIANFCRIKLLMTYLTETDQFLNDSRKASRWFPFMKSITIETLAAEQNLTWVGSKVRNNLICARCVAAERWTPGRTYVGLKDHLKQKHHASILATIDIFNSIDVPVHFAVSLSSDQLI